MHHLNEHATIAAARLRRATPTPLAEDDEIALMQRRLVEISREIQAMHTAGYRLGMPGLREHLSKAGTEIFLAIAHTKQEVG